MASTFARFRAALALVQLAQGGQAAAPIEPPTEFRLFRFGRNETTKGVFLLTKDDAQACLERQLAYGNDLSIDFGHGVLEESQGTPQRAAGWIGGLEVRPDGLWAVRVSWTDEAASMIRKRQQRFYSPLFGVEKGHIVEIINVALTLTPATCNLTPLVASRASSPPPKAPRTMQIPCTQEELKKLADEFEKMAGADGASDEMKAMAALLRKLADEGSDDEEEGDEGKAATSRIVEAARKVTDLSDPGEIAGALEALKDAGRSVVEASAQDKQRERVNAMVKLHATPGPKCKITPAQVKPLIEKGMQDEKWLVGYLKTLPVLAVAASVASQAAGARTDIDGETGEQVVLSEEEERVMKLSGISREDWIKGRSRRL